MKILLALVIAVTPAFNSLVLASENMSFKGTLLETPPCEINGGQPVEIDFGEVGVNKINGENYSRTFVLTYECEGPGTDKLLRYVGNATAFDSAAVQSNIADFGIRLAHRTSEGITTPFEVGSTLPISAQIQSSVFVATPVKKMGAKLPEGAFFAGATLQLDYP
ncbi:fimbrial protein [Enterobacter bugandensis]|uniref:fimbrial protein n=1 Tax=Enterobacter bugandensis TaxID=881260 RepID=UPI0013D643F4|nr:fimbrial protein [Enterobacter bugandensis]